MLVCFFPISSSTPIVAGCLFSYLIGLLIMYNIGGYGIYIYIYTYTYIHIYIYIYMGMSGYEYVNPMPQFPPIAGEGLRR